VSIDVNELKARNDIVSGVYCIRNTVSGRRYVGQALRFSERQYEHFKALRSGKHHCGYLQNAHRKYGHGAFEFVILERCVPAVLTEREQYWMDYYRARCGIYNSAPAAGSTRGYKFTEEQRQKLRASHIGEVKVYSIEGLERKAESLRHRSRQPWFRAKLSAALKGRVPSAAIAASPKNKKGRLATDAERAILLQAAKRPKSAETRARMSLAWKRIWATRKARCV
jgi:group I intron endonuclease